MSEEKDFLEQLRSDKRATGFSIYISSNNGISITCASRKEPGAKLEKASIENASEVQLASLCDALDNMW